MIVLGIIGSMQDSGGIYVPPPPPPAPDATGQWMYTILAPNIVINGDLQISGPSEQLQLRSQATYQQFGPDGRMHSINERFNWVGTLNGIFLNAQCTGGSYVVDGYPMNPILPMSLSLQLSSDSQSMQGQVQNPSGTGNITASRR